MENNHFQQLQNSLTDLEKQVANSLTKLASSIENLAAKIEILASLHLKIIYWLLIVVTLTLVGVKGVESFRILSNPVSGGH